MKDNINSEVVQNTDSSVSNDAVGSAAEAHSDSTSGNIPQAEKNNNNYVYSVQSNTPLEEPKSQKELNFEALRRSKRESELEVERLRKQLEERNKASKIKETEAIEARLKEEAIEARLKNEYKDLDKVLSPNNIEVLKARDPQFASIISSGKGAPEDLYHRAIAAYSLIKKYGIYIEDNHADDRARVEENLSKPKPTSAISSGSESLGEFAEFANMDTEERRRAIFKKVMERASGI